MNIFSPDYQEQFTLFSMSHLVTMAVFAMVWILMPYTLRKGVSEKTDKRICYAMASVLVGQYLSWMLWEALTGRFTLQLSLPLNLCDMSNFLLAVLLVNKNRKLFEVLYFLALAGAIQSFITPNITFAFPHFEFFVFYVQHGGEILVILYFVFVLKYRPRPISIVKTYAWLLAFIIGVYIFNFIADANYMFLMADTPHPSTVTRMIALFGDPPRHIIGLSLVAIFSILVLYVPWLIVDLKNRHRGA